MLSAWDGFWFEMGQVIADLCMIAAVFGTLALIVLAVAFFTSRKD